MVKIDQSNLAEPAQFDERCRQPGMLWLANNPDSPPKDFWSPFKPALAEAFHHRCSYSTLRLVFGATIDHFIPKSSSAGRSRAYEWSNFRYCSSEMNQRKHNAAPNRILDPLLVEDDWFELLYPSLQLVPTPNIPVEFRDRADFTLDRLKLRDGEAAIRFRQEWLHQYRLGNATLSLIDIHCPLVSRLIRQHNIQLYS